jgi:hypothetical protein
MTTRRDPPQLTSDLDYWEVELKSGAKATIRAHGVAERDGY